MRSLTFPMCVSVMVVAASAKSQELPEKPVRMHEAAVPWNRPADAPAESAVCFSSRWSHPTHAQDPWDTFQAAAAFHATDFVWVYSLDPQFVGRLRKHAAENGGRAVILAVNSMIPDPPDFRRRERGRILDWNGNRITAPWMRSWADPAWGCANSPEYRAGFVEYAARALAAGATALQMDDARMNMAAVAWGGCFCPHCMEKFRRYLRDRTTLQERTACGIENLDDFDYGRYLRDRRAPAGDAFAKYDGGPLKSWFRDFQEASVREFFRDVRAEIDARANRHVVFSTNNYRGSWDSPYDLFEIGMAELPLAEARPENLHRLLADARAKGKTQIFTVVPKVWDGSEAASTRRAIAACYALGGHVIVPWDVYTGSNTPRYYGRPEDYADLYAFVRQYSDCFDGYEEAYFARPGPAETSVSAAANVPPCLLEEAEGLTVVVRAKPGDATASVVIHLIDGRDEPRPFRIRLAHARFFDSPALQVRLLRPGKVPQELAVRQDAVWSAVQVPALQPWGLLVVSRDGAASQSAATAAESP